MASEFVDAVNLLKRLQKYCDSIEEKILTDVLGLIVSDFAPICLNLNITSCNAMRGCSFTKAFVELQPYASGIDLLKTKEFFISKQDIPSMSVDQLFNLKFLKNISENGVRAVMDSLQNARVVLTLLDFLHDIEIHQRAIYDVKKIAHDETKIMVVLAQHLFSQLVPSKKYMVDQNAKQLPKSCLCSCKEKIISGKTGIGSGATWHGNADIMLDQTLAVAVIESTDDDDDDDDESSGEEFGEPERKKQKTKVTEPEKSKQCTIKETANQKEVCVKIKKKKVLLKAETFDQIVAETITNAFAQVNMNSCLEGMLIPTFGCTSDFAYVFLYDPVNDLLMHSCPLLDLWPSPGILNMRTVITLWLFLNFSTFMLKNLSEKFYLTSSGFHKIVKEKLAYYKKIQTNMDIDVADTVTDYEGIYPLLRDLSKKVEQKNDLK